MRHPRQLPALLLVLSLAVVAAACGSTAPATPTVGPSAAAATPAVSPGASTGASQVPSISTPWGHIVEGVPASFPVFPSAVPLPVAQVTSGPVSAAWTAPAGVLEVAAWYRDQLAMYGFIDVQLQPAAADGSRVIDAILGKAGCETQMTIRAQGSSALITVLWGSSCATLGN